MPLSITPGPILSTHSIILIYTSVRLVHKKNGATVEEEVREKNWKNKNEEGLFWKREFQNTHTHKGTDFKKSTARTTATIMKSNKHDDGKWWINNV